MATQNGQMTLKDALTTVENSYIRADVKLAEILEDFRQKRQLLFDIIQNYETRLAQNDAEIQKEKKYIALLEDRAKNLGLNAEELAKLQETLK